VHCTPAPGADRGKVLYSWAVQSSPRSARKAELRREAANRPRGRLTPRPRSMQPPPGTVPRYGEVPESAKEALDRSSAEFTAGRLSERAQHARQAAARAAAARPPADQDAGQPAEQGADQAVAVAADPQAAGDNPATDATEQPTAQWAWLPIAAMTVPLLLLLLVALV
jgi:hypothetical protein